MSYAMCLSKKGKYTTEIEPIETCGLFSRYIAVFRDYFEKNHIRLTIAHTFLDLSHRSESNDMQHGYVLSSSLGDT